MTSSVSKVHMKSKSKFILKTLNKLFETILEKVK